MLKSYYTGSYISLSSSACCFFVTFVLFVIVQLSVLEHACCQSFIVVVLVFLKAVKVL